MPYSVKADLEAKIGKDSLAQLTNDVAGAVDSDDVVITALIAEADGIIDSYVGTVYAVPLLTIPQNIKDISAVLACYFGLQRRFTETKLEQLGWTARYGVAMDILKKIANEELRLDADTPEQSPEIQFSAPDKTFDFNNPDSPTSGF